MFLELGRSLFFLLVYLSLHSLLDRSLPSQFHQPGRCEQEARHEGDQHIRTIIVFEMVPHIPDSSPRGVFLPHQFQVLLLSWWG